VPEIDAVIWLRPTQSLTAWLQGNGRGLRVAPGKSDLLILDHVNNCRRLDHPLVSHEWSLDGKRKRQAEQAPSVKVCPVCFATSMSAAQACRECGHVFAPQETRELQQVEGELVEVAARERKREQGKAQSLQDLIALGHSRGYKNAVAWAKHVMYARSSK
jgi:superfamily II DNA or RNA helicase